MHRRLSDLDVDELVSGYLAAHLDKNRTTILSHLDRRCVARTKSVRKMTDQSVREAGRRDEMGPSLKAVAIRFDVYAQTLARDLKRAGVQIRPRRRWPGA